MKRVGSIGLGNMGIGLAKNLLKNGFALTGLHKTQGYATILNRPEEKMGEIAASSLSQELSPVS